MTERMITNGQLYALNSLIISLMDRKNDRNLRLFIVSSLLDKKVRSTKSLTLADWQKIRDQAFPNWTDDDWEPGAEFKKEVSALNEEYLEEIGYQKLFILT